MSGLYHRNVASTRNASDPVKLINIPPLPEESVKHLIHLLQNDIAEKQRNADEGEFDFSQGQSVILLNICQEALE
jgi:hypothetical protein